MKWATNKRLHLEIASLKSIQNLQEIRLSDVITAMGKANPAELAGAVPAATAPATPTPEPAAPESTVPVSEPEPAPSGGSVIDNLIASAPEEAIEPEPVRLNPGPAAPAAEEKSPEEPEAPESNFHDDPLIKEALKVFKGRLIS